MRSNRPARPVVSGFGARLREARLRAGYTSQPQLARKLGLHVMTIWKHESSDEAPSDEMVRAYARTLGVTDVWLRYGAESTDGAATVPRAVDEYLSGHRAIGLDPEVADRLRRIQWSVLTAGEVDDEDVHQARRLIEKLLRRYREERERERERASASASVPPDEPHRQRA